MVLENQQYCMLWIGFFNGSKDGELTEEDATYNHADEPIEVSVTFNQLTDSDKRALGSILRKAQMNLLLGKLTTKAKRFCPQTQKVTLFLTTLRDWQKQVIKKDAYNDLQNRHPELNLPKAATRRSSLVMHGISAWEQSHSDQLEDIPEEVSTSFNGFNGNAR